MAVSSIISGIGGLASNLFNIGEQRNVNRQQMDFSREMWEKQGLREKEFWEMQNAYNDPAAQMKRLSDAGLNPNLVYGNGATTQAAALSPKQSHGISPKAGQLDLSSVAQSAMMLKQMNANIARTEAETKAIEARTENQIFDNTVKQSLGYQNFVDAGRAATQKLQAQSSKEVLDWESTLAASFGLSGLDVQVGSHTLTGNTPAVLAKKAGLDRTIQEAENSKKLGDIRGFESAIKAFEVQLTKQGISPNSPWYAKIIGDLLTRLLGTNIQDIGDALGKGLRGAMPSMMPTNLPNQ